MPTSTITIPTTSRVLPTITGPPGRITAIRDRTTAPASPPPTSQVPQPVAAPSLREVRASSSPKVRFAGRPGAAPGSSLRVGAYTDSGPEHRVRSGIPVPRGVIEPVAVGLDRADAGTANRCRHCWQRTCRPANASSADPETRRRDTRMRHLHPIGTPLATYRQVRRFLAMIPPSPAEVRRIRTRPFWQAPLVNPYKGMPSPVGAGLAAAEIAEHLWPARLAATRIGRRARSRRPVPHRSARRLPWSHVRDHSEVHSREDQSHETHAAGTGDRRGLGDRGLDRAAGRAEAQVPGESMVYETVSPGYNTVTYGERVKVRRGPFKTVIKERPVAYVTRTPPVVRETRLVQPAPVVENVVVQPPPVVESVFVQPAPILERRLVQPAPVIQSRVIQRDPVVQTRYLVPVSLIRLGARRITPGALAGPYLRRPASWYEVILRPEARPPILPGGGPSPDAGPGMKNLDPPRPGLPRPMAAAGPRGPTGRAPGFDAKVAPILARRCLDCHSGAEPKGKLDLSRRAAALRGRRGRRRRSSPGKPDESPLWERVEAGEMPPKAPLPEAEKAALRAWIAAGAAWGTDPIDPFRVDDRPPGRPRLVVAPAGPPARRRPRSSATGLGPLADRRLRPPRSSRPNGLSPAPEADRRTLIRRLSFDLTGLPPTPEEVDAFLADPSPDAYERLVDRLLASPAVRRPLGPVVARPGPVRREQRLRVRRVPPERLAVSRLGGRRPQPRPALRRVRPPPARRRRPPARRPAARSRRPASSSPGPTTRVGQNQQSEAMKAVVRADELEDLVGTVGQAFLGLTVHCARCHDHKFDPIRQAEYYRIASALGGVRHGERDLSAHRPRGRSRSEATDRRPGRAARGDRGPGPGADPGRSREAAEPAPRPSRPGTSTAASTTASARSGVTLQGGATLTPEGLRLDGKTGFADDAPAARGRSRPRRSRPGSGSTTSTSAAGA